MCAELSSVQARARLCCMHGQWACCSGPQRPQQLMMHILLRPAGAQLTNQHLCLLLRPAGAQGCAAAPQQSALFSDLQNSILVPMIWCLLLRHAGAQNRQCNMWSRLLLLRPPGATAGHASPTLSSMECNTAAAASLDGLRSPAQHSTASAAFTLGSQQAHSRDCIWVAGLCPTL